MKLCWIPRLPNFSFHEKGVRGRTDTELVALFLSQKGQGEERTAVVDVERRVLNEEDVVGHGGIELDDDDFGRVTL